MLELFIKGHHSIPSQLSMVIVQIEASSKEQSPLSLPKLGSCWTLNLSTFVPQAQDT